MKLKIEVTSDDINEGVRSSVSSCPIACALKRQGYSPVSAAPDRIAAYCDSRKTWIIGKTPKEAETFMSLFDADNPVQPFSFEIEANEVGPNKPDDV